MRISLKRALAAVLSAGILLTCGAGTVSANEADAPSTDTQTEFSNPLMGGGDPFVMRWNGRYYLYCSSGDETVTCHSSLDLVNWTDEGVCAKDGRLWNAYAPEVIYYNGYFYMYTSPDGRGHYVLRAEAPTGPFEIITGNMGRGIDGDVFIDDDGKWYFLTSGGTCITQYEMTSPSSFGAETALRESTIANSWTEGPMVLKIDGYYFMTFTGNHVWHKGYRIGYASGSDYNALTRKSETMLVSTTGDMISPGHSSSVKGPNLDSYYIAYHSHDIPKYPDIQRVVNIERLITNGDRMEVLGPTTTPQQMPEQPDIYAHFETDADLAGWNDGRIVDGQLSLKSGEMAYSKAQIEGDFTAEFCLSGMDGYDGLAGAVFAYKDVWNYGVASLDAANQALQVRFVQDGETVDSYTFPLTVSFNEPVRFDCVQSVQIERSGNDYTFFFNDRQVGTATLSEEYDLTAGSFGLYAEQGDATFTYAGITGAVRGSSLKTYAKPIPGRLQADTCMETGYEQELTGNAYAVKAEAGETYSYRVNVAEGGYYDLSAYYRSDGDAELTVAVDGQVVCQDSLPAAEQYGTNVIRRIAIPAGYHTITVTYGDSAPVVMYYDLEKYEAATEGAVDLSAPTYSDGPWTMQGDAVAMTDAGSGFGKRLYGSDAWGDYTAEADITATANMNGGLVVRATNPDSGIYANDLNQSAPAMVGTDYIQGYFIGVGQSSVTIGKQDYNWKVVASAAFSGSVGTTYHVKAVCIGANIKVYVDDVLYVDYTDPVPFLNGRVGFRNHNTATTFANLTVAPITENETETPTPPDVPNPPAPPVDEPIPGDVDASGTVDVADIMKLKALIMADTWSDKELAVGDLDGSKRLDVGDIMAVKNRIMGAE